MTRAFILYMNLPELLPKCLAYACVCNAVCVSIFCLWNNRVDIYCLKYSVIFYAATFIPINFRWATNIQTYHICGLICKFIVIKVTAKTANTIFTEAEWERVSQREWTLINVNAIRNVNAITASCNERRSQCKNLKGAHKRSVTSRDTERAWVGERKFASATQ